MSGSAGRPRRHSSGRTLEKRSTSEDALTISRQASGDDLRSPVEQALGLAQTRARKAEEALREYDQCIEAAIEEAVEWAAEESQLIDGGEASADGRTAWETLASTGRSMGLLTFIGGGAESSTHSAEEEKEALAASLKAAPRAQVVAELEKFLQRTLCWRAASRSGTAGVKSADKLSRSSSLSRSPDWPAMEKAGAFVLVAARMDAERRAAKAEGAATEAQRKMAVTQKELTDCEGRLRNLQRLLRKLSQRCALHESAAHADSCPLCKSIAAEGDGGDLPPTAMELGGPWGVVRDMAMGWFCNPDVPVPKRIGAGSLCAVAALWLCRGVFLVCRGLGKKIKVIA